MSDNHSCDHGSTSSFLDDQGVRIERCDLCGSVRIVAPRWPLEDQASTAYRHRWRLPPIPALALRSPASAPAATVAIAEIEALVAKWRAEADELEAGDFDPEALQGATALSVHAEELEALLPSARGAESEAGDGE